MRRVELVWKPPFFPYARINQVPLEEVRQKLIEIFTQWGKAGAFRVDNGEPFGSPSSNPTPALALWLIAHDIDMIWNKPYCPQMNNKVEKMQDTTQRWAEIHKCANINDLQIQLNKQILIQRQHYPVTRLQGKTRLFAFPELAHNKRVFSHDNFNHQRVYDFLSKKIYVRKVSSNAQINLFGQKMRVKPEYKNQYVQVQLSNDGLNWIINANNKLVKTTPANQLMPHKIRNLTVFSKN